MIKGNIIALITPFLDNGDIDYNAVSRLCDMHLENGIDGLLLLGTTAEAESLSNKEKLQLVRYIINKVDNRIKIMVGLISNRINEILNLSKELEEFNIDSYLVISPYYTKTNKMGLVKWYTYIADNVNKPIVIYNVPKRVGMEIPSDLVCELSYYKNIIGIKDASGNTSYYHDIKSKCNKDFLYYCGDDLSLLEFSLLGIDGVISVISNRYPKAVDEILKGNHSAFYKIYPLLKVMYKEVSPIGIKYILYLNNLVKLNYRIPLHTPSIENQNEIISVLNKL